MSGEFNVNAYWLERGRNYMGEQRTPGEFHRLQERFLLDILKGAALPMGRILELGCGFGRITKLLSEAWPEAEITAVDLSPEQLANARKHCGEDPRIHFAQYDFYSGQPLPSPSHGPLTPAEPSSHFSVAVAIEVFLHHPPEMIMGLMRKLAAASKYIVNIDWSESWPWPTPEHVWVHDYARLYAEAGLKCASFPLPAKVDGKQQKLFIAGKEVPASVLNLEEDLKAAMPAVASATASDDWAEQLQRASAELQNLIPIGASFILVDDAQWGRLRALEDHRVIPFLERNGEYWGPAADDATAWQELQRLRQSGAAYIVFAWPSFWWLEHFKEFAQRLRREFGCVLENERLVVFRLT